MTPRQADAKLAFLNPEKHSEGFQKIARHLQEKVTDAALVQALVTRGRIRASKPKDGIFAYVWRWAQFHNGTNTCIPMTIDFDLCIQLERDGAGCIMGSKMTVSREEARFVMDWLESWSDWLIIQTGGNPWAGARRWAPLLGHRAESAL